MAKQTVITSWHISAVRGSPGRHDLPAWDKGLVKGFLDYGSKRGELVAIKLNQRSAEEEINLPYTVP
jgi:hypothetical protein